MSKMDDQHIVIDPDVYLPPEYKQQQHPQKQQCSVRISIQSTTNHFKTPEQFERMFCRSCFLNLFKLILSISFALFL
jgi:hypothetical protein